MVQQLTLSKWEGDQVTFSMGLLGRRVCIDESSDLHDMCKTTRGRLAAIITKIEVHPDVRDAERISHLDAKQRVANRFVCFDPSHVGVTLPGYTITNQVQRRPVALISRMASPNEDELCWNNVWKKLGVASHNRGHLASLLDNCTDSLCSLKIPVSGYAIDDYGNDMAAITVRQMSGSYYHLEIQDISCTWIRHLRSRLEQIVGKE